MFTMRGGEGGGFEGHGKYITENACGSNAGIAEVARKRKAARYSENAF